MFYFIMIEEYTQAATKYEKKAGEYRLANRGTRYNPDAAECYEKAGDNRTIQAACDKKMSSGRGKINTSLSSAIQDYNLAIRYLDSNDRGGQERIEGKINSIEKTIKSSIKKRTPRKLSRMGIDFKNPLERLMEDDITVGILSIIAFSFALLLSSFSITGFIINGTTMPTSSHIALVCFVAGLILATLYLKRGAKKTNKAAKKKLSKKKK